MIGLLFCAWLLWLFLFVYLNKQLNSKRDAVNGVVEVTELDIIIAARDEGDSIEQCIASIYSQSWLPENVRVIIVDDHSTDNTVSKIQQIQTHSKLKIELLRLDNKKGKKNALRFALRETNAEFILQLDADCVLGGNCIHSLFGDLIQHDLDASFGEVRFMQSGFWSKLLAFENLNNQCVTEAFINAKRPIMANGAIMAFRKSVVDLYADTLLSNIASGDDVFFIQRLGKTKRIIGYCQSAFVFTKAPESIRAFMHQRLRWASKVGTTELSFGSALSAFIWLVQVIFLFFLVLSPFMLGSFWILFIWGLKWVVEFSFQRYWFAKRKISFPVLYSFALSALYPFYIGAIGLLSLFKPKISWKGRPV